jgi:hypothetical protein
MRPVLARYYEIDQTTQMLALAIIAGVLTLALAVVLWFAFRNRR